MARQLPLRRDDEPAFVLHTYPYRESSLIVEAFTPAFGRVSMVARGAKRPRSELRGLLNAFQPLADVDDLGQGAAAGEQARRDLQRPHRRRQPDPLQLRSRGRSWALPGGTGRGGRWLRSAHRALRLLSSAEL